jgi:hypothetical protein
MGIQHKYLRSLQYLRIKDYEKTSDRLRKAEIDWEIHKGRK